MLARTVRIKARARRATVMIMVVGVLAMLFIIGSTLLIVSRFERQAVGTTSRAKSMAAVTEGILAPVSVELRTDLLGSDDKAYNRAWLGVPGGDSALGTDYGDYPGYPGADLNANPPRNGDLILASLEPFLVDDMGTGNPADDDWRYFSASSSSDTAVFGGEKYLKACVACANPANDADGDGVEDAVGRDIPGFSDPFGGNFRMGLRVIPHTASVWLDRMTHPALLAQVIHPLDITGTTVEQLRLEIDSLRLGPTDEDDLRRRFMLPRQLPTPEPGKDYRSVASPLVNLLPITMGYAVPDAPTRWRTDNGDHRQFIPFQQGQEGKWQDLIAPRFPMTDSNYKARDDVYDRRRLVTVNSSDDALRPQRDERRLQAFTVTLGIAPDTVPFNLENLISPVDASVRSPASADPQTRPLAYGVMDYRGSGGSIEHVFNTDGLRPQFSLRDVLDPVLTPVTVPPGGYWQGAASSYRRAMQLTAYFLAMIQHSSVPGSNGTYTLEEKAEQLRTAMQLAVNTIDFADVDQVTDDNGDFSINSMDAPDYISTCLTLDPDEAGPHDPITVCGVEKQPYITEAYVKRIKRGDAIDPKNPQWVADEGGKTFSIYAVELYNPYDDPLDLSGIVLRSGTGADIDLGATVGSIAARKYVVVANQADDPTTTSTDPFIAGATIGVDLFEAPTLTIDNATPIRLVRTDQRLAEVTAKGWNCPPVEYPVPNGIELDRIDRADPAAIVGDPDCWALDVEGLASLHDPQNPSIPPVVDGKYLVRDSSLQRHKEVAGQPPVYWHFTLARHVLFPLPWYEHPQYPDPNGSPLPPPGLEKVISKDEARPSQHNLLGTGMANFACPAVDGGWTNPQIVERAFAGIPFAYNTSVPAASITPPINGFPNVVDNPLPIAGFPVLTADRGIHSETLGTLAFPTTGTLLLVTRYAHLLDDPVTPGIQQLPITVAATLQLNRLTGPIVRPDPSNPSQPYGNQHVAQMWQLDNGHLPIFDEVQNCLDGNNSRFNGLPWGQLAFEYFTALPMEELARRLPALGSQRLMDFDPVTYRNEYGAAGGDWSDPTKSRFLNYPVMMPVSQAPSPLGPRVQGRIGIGVAPWWVLDGLPVLPDAPLGDPNNAIPPGSSVSLAGLPVPEIEAQRLDPVGKPMAGALFVHDLIDEMYRTPVSPYTSTSMPPAPPAGMPSISPKLAQYMVSYREERQVGTRNASVPNRVGFATTGELCNVMRSARFDFNVRVDPNKPDLITPNLDDLRLAVNDAAIPPTRPYSYLGYLQLVTPVVRLEDWATVKNHVFTVYATIQSTGQPPVAVRTQMTIDRTRCLYNPGDLPERITETEPISYFNAMDD